MILPEFTLFLREFHSLQRPVAGTPPRIQPHTWNSIGGTPPSHTATHLELHRRDPPSHTATHLELQRSQLVVAAEEARRAAGYVDFLQLTPAALHGTRGRGMVQPGHHTLRLRPCIYGKGKAHQAGLGYLSLPAGIRLPKLTP